jgi:pilus assembly protein CpaB
MKRLPLIIGMVAIVLFVATTTYINRYLQSLKAPVSTTVEPLLVAPVVVAAEDLPVGIMIQQHQVRTISWPAEALPLDAAASPEEIVGALTTASIVTNEPVLPNKYVVDDDHSLMSLKIPRGMRAVSIRVDAVSGISGFVTPGTKVDVITVMETTHVDGGRGAFTLLEDIDVLAIAQEMDTRDAEPKVVSTVTLLVTPDQAERLALAGRGGSLQLSLRSYRDRYPTGTSGVSLAQIAFSRPGRHNTVELIRGKNRIVHTF